MNTKQYNRCVDMHADNLYRFVLSVVRQSSEAQDIVQESFTRLWEHRSKVMQDKEKSFLFTIAYRLSISELRNRNKITLPDFTLHEHAVSSEYNNLNELTWQALDTLSENQRSALILCDWEGYSYNEIAEITQTTLAQVKTNIHRARNTIKELLKDEYGL